MSPLVPSVHTDVCMCTTHKNSATQSLQHQRIMINKTFNVTVGKDGTSWHFEQKKKLKKAICSFYSQTILQCHYCNFESSWIFQGPLCQFEIITRSMLDLPMRTRIAQHPYQHHHEVSSTQQFIFMEILCRIPRAQTSLSIKLLNTTLFQQ